MAEVATTRRRRWVAAAGAAVLVLVVLSTVLFLWPPTGQPSPADAIVVIGGSGDRHDKALQLAQRHLAPVLVFSLPEGAQNPACHPATGAQPGHLASWQRRAIQLQSSGITVLCFAPSPISTQGEGEEVGRLAARYHWRSIILVTSREQAFRARIRVERCYHGHLEAAAVPVGLHLMPYTVAYEWGALLKALVLQRSC